MEKRILHVISSISAGGIESLVVSLYKNIDRNKFQFDFAVLNPNNPIHKEVLEKLGANIYFIADAGSKNNLLSKLLWRIKARYNYIKLISKNKYDVVHCHNFNDFGFYILFATIKKIPVRIVHSHTSSNDKESKLIRVFRRLKNILNLEILITDKIGCSDEAVKWLYGQNAFKYDNVQTIYNGIDMDEFSRDSYLDKYKETRELYGIKPGINFINIGRFSTVKNQMFLIELFYMMTKERKDVYLNIVGFGPLEQSLKDQVKLLKIENRVRFFKADTNINQILSIMDFFILPSITEGLGIVAIEAQAMNIPIFISDTVTKEVDIGLATYLSLDKGAKYWASYIINSINNNTYPKKSILEKKELFNIKNIAKKFEDLYR